MKIEGENVSAIDVAHYLEELKGNISVRKIEKYIDPATETEMNLLGDDYDEQVVIDAFSQFYGNQINIRFFIEAY